MHELYELKEMLMKELEEYGRKGELTSGSLEVVDKLSHTIKNLCKIIEAYEEEEEYSMAGGGSYEGGNYSRRGGNNYSRRGGQGGGNYSREGGNNMRYSREGGSYARGRGRNARRDSMGRYSSEGYSMAGEEMVESLRELMQDAPDEQTRMEFQRFIQKMEQMQ